MIPNHKPIEASEPTAYEYEFSFCTLVTDETLYTRMYNSFLDAGFDNLNSEYLFLDNISQESGDGYKGLNHLLSRAKGKYAVLCHQDILAIDGPERLRELINELDALDSDWGVFGNAGCDITGKPYFYLNEQNTVHIDINRSPPKLVETLDENLLIIRQDSRLCFSNDLVGYHMYGTDLATQANFNGLSAYVADFRVEHLGKGTLDDKFFEICDAFELKYQKATQRKRLVPTTGMPLNFGADTKSLKGKRQRLHQISEGHVHTKKRIKSHIQKHFNRHAVLIEGQSFKFPQNVPYAALQALREGFYEQPERNLIQQFLPTDLPVIELGGSYGIISGLINRTIDNDCPMIVVEANPELLSLCKENGLSTYSSRDFRLRNLAIDYTGSKAVSFIVSPGVHDSHVATASQLATADQRQITVPATTLAEILVNEDITSDYALVCDIEGGEFGVVAREREALAKCQCAIIELHPRSFYDSGETVTTFIKTLQSVGLEIVASERTVVAAVRRKDR